jgi:hypothetical protein
MRVLALVNGQLLPKRDRFQCQVVTRDHEGGDIRKIADSDVLITVMLLARP